MKLKFIAVAAAWLDNAPSCHRWTDQSAASGSDSCPHQLSDVRIYVVLLLLQEKGIPLMGESSFLASWVNRRAMMMGKCVCLKIVLLFGSRPTLSFVKPTTQGMFFPPWTMCLWHLYLTIIFLLCASMQVAQSCYYCRSGKIDSHWKTA